MSVKEQDLKIEPDEISNDGVSTLIDGVAGLIADEAEAELYRLQHMSESERVQYQQFLEDGIPNEEAFYKIKAAREIVIAIVEPEPEPIEATIKRKLTAVHYLRLAVQTEQEVYNAALANLNEQYKAQITSLANHKRDLTAAETELRELAVSTYTNPNHDKTDKKPFPGIGIQIKKPTTIGYDPGKAFEWAKQKDICLSLDATAFEAICLTPSKPDFVSVNTVETPTGTIDKDLSKALITLGVEQLEAMPKYRAAVGDNDDLPEAS